MDGLRCIDHLPSRTRTWVLKERDLGYENRRTHNDQYVSRLTLVVDLRSVLSVPGLLSVAPRLSSRWTLTRVRTTRVPPTVSRVVVPDPLFVLSAHSTRSGESRGCHRFTGRAPRGLLWRPGVHPWRWESGSVRTEVRPGSVPCLLRFLHPFDQTPCVFG